MIVDGSYPPVIFFPIEIDSTRFLCLYLAAPTITIENDENENDAWTEYRHLFENHRSHTLNPSSNGQNYLLRHSSANTSLNESTSLEPMVDNHEDLLSLIEQAGISFGIVFSLSNHLIRLGFFFYWRSVSWIFVRRSFGKYQRLSFV